MVRHVKAEFNGNLIGEATTSGELTRFEHESGDGKLVVTISDEIPEKVQDEYRVVKWYQGFFSHWVYRLEKKVQKKFLWKKWTVWEEVAGNGLTESEPSNWKEFNIVSKVTRNP